MPKRLSGRTYTEGKIALRKCKSKELRRIQCDRNKRCVNGTLVNLEGLWDRDTSDLPFKSGSFLPLLPRQIQAQCPTSINFGLPHTTWLFPTGKIQYKPLLVHFPGGKINVLRNPFLLRFSLADLLAL